MLEYDFFKKLIFNFDPESAHTLAELGMRGGALLPFVGENCIERNFVHSEMLEQEIFGRKFFNPVGIGAGFDKNGTMIKGLHALGFGCVEVGTVTPKPQKGNPKPRLFRLISEESIQNGMGFNNDGAYALQAKLKKLYPYSLPIGVNIGKNKTTEQMDAISDYAHLVKAFKNLCDYFVVNISSPNTPNLRDLQNEEFISALFNALIPLTNRPIILKISPDMSVDTAISLCKKAIECGASGIMATNTTIDYSLSPNAKSFGGLSGKVLTEKSYTLFREIAKELYGKSVLISVGGIDSADEAYRRIRAGASLVQIYTALIFKGWNLVRDINLGLIERLKADGFANIKDAVGADLR